VSLNIVNRVVRYGVQCRQQYIDLHATSRHRQAALCRSTVSCRVSRGRLFDGSAAVNRWCWQPVTSTASRTTDQCSSFATSPYETQATTSVWQPTWPGPLEL